MKRTIFLLLNILVLHGQISYSQDIVRQRLDSFVKHINAFSYVAPQEKVYLHFDNTGYYAGEDIWFKAYVVVSENNKYTSLSKVLYVELLSPEGDIIATKKIKLDDGRGHGDIQLKENLKTGYYEVRAYTRYMLNWEVDHCFSRTFPVYSKPLQNGEYTTPKIPTPRYDRLSQREKTVKQENVNISFYPEGGNLVTGLRSRVAFKATGNQGQDIEVAGTVYNQQGEQISNFITMHQGMGFFELIPDGGNYKAKVIYNDKEYAFNLPESQSSGYVLSVNSHQDNKYMLIQLQKSESISSDSIGISVSCRGKVYAFDPLLLGDNPYILRLPKDKLLSGCYQITVFDSYGRILADRLSFINNHDFGTIEASMSKAVYSPNEQIKVDFTLNDKEGNPLKTEFSVSVRDADTEIPTFYNDNILSDLLLSSELRGYINNPSYYFEKDDRNSRLFLDLLMMVQGWRRYNWQQMAGLTSFAPTHPIEKGILVEGTVLSVFGKKKRENIEVTKLITNKDNGFAVGSCMTDSLGNFNFLMDIEGIWNMTLQTKEKKKTKDYRISLHRNFSPSPRSYSYYETLIGVRRPVLHNEKEPLLIENDTLIENNNDDVKSHWLDEVTVTKKVDNLEDEAFERANIIYDVKEEVDKIRDSGEYEDGDIWEFLSRLNPYFSFLYGNRELIKLINGEYESLNAPSSPQKCLYKGKLVVFVVNNNPVGEGHFYENIDQLFVSQIESIAIVEDNNPSFKYTDVEKLANPDNLEEINKRYVTVYIYTNKDGVKRQENKGIRPTKLVGYSIPVDFYNPDYSHGIPNLQMDFRRTLYWNPSVKTNSNGKATVSFYNNDTCRQLYISAEGLTEDGQILIINDMK